MDYLEMCRNLKILAIKSISDMEIEEHEAIARETEEEFKEYTITRQLTLENGDSVEFTSFFQDTGNGIEYADVPEESDYWQKCDDVGGVGLATDGSSDLLSLLVDGENKFDKEEGYTEALRRHVIEAIETAEPDLEDVATLLTKFTLADNSLKVAKESIVRDEQRRQLATLGLDKQQADAVIEKTKTAGKLL